MSGFFSDSLQRKLVDVDYYVTIGGIAYNALSRIETDTLSPVFAELAEKFVGFVDVLSEVSERTSCTSNADLLRLVREMAQDRQPPKRATADRARSRAERLNQDRPHPVSSQSTGAGYVTLSVAEIVSHLRPFCYTLVVSC